MAQTAKYPLEAVFKKIQKKQYWFSAPSRSIDPIIEAFEGSGQKMGIEQAESLRKSPFIHLTKLL